MALSSKYDPRVHVGLLEERVTNVSSTDFPGHYPDEDHSWDLAKFKKVCIRCLWCQSSHSASGNAQKLQVKIQKLSTRSIEFDLVGVDASIANALRRLLIAEVWVMILKLYGRMLRTECRSRQLQ
jgi:DNA-directed RNA polymerase I and III subunit RPAC1